MIRTNIIILIIILLTIIVLDFILPQPPVVTRDTFPHNQTREPSSIVIGLPVSR